MSTFFSNCNYSPNTIQSAINRISTISQTEALQPRLKGDATERTPLVLTYHPHIHRIKCIFILRKSYNMKNQTPEIYLLHLLYWPTNVTPTSNNCSSQAPLIRNQMAHTPVEIHYAATMNTSILPMPYLVPRTLSIFNITLLAHLSVLPTPLLVPNAPFYILVKLAVSSVPDLENT